MTKLTRKLMISVFTLAFALVTLGASTFAWFTLTSTANIDTLDLNVVAGEGIEISLDGNTYRNKFDKEDLLAANPDAVTVFDAVTTADGVTFTTIDPEEPANQYLEFKLWVRSPNRHAKVYLDDLTKVSSEKSAWRSDTTFDYRKTDPATKAVVNAGDTIDVYAANALRFSFQSYTGTTSEGFAAAKSDDATIFELDSAIGSGETNLNIRLGSTVNTTQGLVKYWKAKLNQELDTSNVLLPLTVYHNEALGLKGSANEGFPDIEVGEPKAPIAVLDQQVETDVNGNWYGFLMVRIWLEGWDPDSFDAILNKKMSIEFSFKVTTAVPETSVDDETGGEV